MLEFVTTNLLWSQGTFLLAILAGIVALGLFFRPLLYGAVTVFLFFLFFFRNPTRICLEAKRDASVLVCPSDGKIVSIETLKDNVDFTHKIAIFLSPFDVHVTRSPIAAKITKILYHKGQFAMAFLPKSSDLNERNDVLLKTELGKKLKVRQIAGTLARVIVCWAHEDEELQAGELFGMIKFGSRVEVFLPESAVINVKKGQRVYGGETVLGRLQ